MNLAVDQPTKMIKLDLSAEDTQSCAPAPGAVRAPGPGPHAGGYSDAWARKGGAIDFYRLFQADGEGAESPYTTACGTNGASDRRSTAGAQVDFLIISLRNDIRVRSFDFNDSSVFVHFWTIDDAISFYRQHFSFRAMRFAAPRRWSGMLLEPCACAAPVRLQPESRRVMDGPRFQQIEPAWDAGDCSAAAQEASDDEAVGRAVVLDKIALVLSRMHDSEPCRRACGKHAGEALRGAGRRVSRRAPDGRCAPPAGRHAEQSRERLIQRVEYFNRMKNFFSKSDVKKMQTLYDEGRLSFLYQNSKEISCGCFSNVVMQNAVKGIGEDGLCEIIENLGEDIVPISATKYGAYTVQTIILCAATARSQGLISHYFAADGRFLIDHEIGNYSIQKILRFDDGLVFDLCMASFPAILGSGLGFKVFKRCIEFFKDRSGDVREMIRRHEADANADKCRALLQLLENN